MDILEVLALLQLLAVPAFTLTRPTQDYWGEFGAYGPCSRTCGTGVAMRTRRCLTSRRDGGHNCLGSSKSFRICNTNECPAGTRDFREEQCSQIDRRNFQGKRYTWVPYFGATNPCELNCVPRGENISYRHRPAVVDGTRCYAGRNDICVDGVCRMFTHEDFSGLDENTGPVHAAAPVAPHPKDTLTYQYRPSAYSQCSVTCNGGMQYRSVECLVLDPVNPRVVDETYCISQRLQRPQSQQACNMQPCAAKYQVSSFGVCSVTCGDGQRTREVYCVGAGGERLGDHACAGLTKPAFAQVCRKPACHAQISWYVAEFGLCTRSCDGGVRDRRVGCFDTNRNSYPEDRCGPTSKPVTVEACNTQPCPENQMVPSVQQPRGHESTVIGFVPYVPGVPSTPKQHANIAYDPYPSVIGPHCAQSYYGCCPDGHTAATGSRHEGCSQNVCIRTRFGCCLDGVTPATGFGRAGCPEYQNTVHSQAPAPPATGAVCSLPRDEGPCDTWKARFYYDSGTGRCTKFWYGDCQGNANNFITMEACQRECGGEVRVRQPAPRRGVITRGSIRSVQRVKA